jgi:hypothetical protein
VGCRCVEGEELRFTAENAESAERYRTKIAHHRAHGEHREIKIKAFTADHAKCVEGFGGIDSSP